MCDLAEKVAKAGLRVARATDRSRDYLAYEVSSPLTNGRCAMVFKFPHCQNLTIMPSLIPSYLQGITTDMIRKAVEDFVQQETTEA